MYVANTSQWTEKHMIEQHNEDRGMLLGERNNNNNNIDDNIWRSTRDLVSIPAPLDDLLYATSTQFSVLILFVPLTKIQTSTARIFVFSFLFLTPGI